MPLLPTIIDSYGFQIKQYIITAPSLQAAPFNIFIYQLPDLPSKFNTSLAEYYTRQQYYNNLDKFKANYYIDNISIWNTSPPQGKIIRIALCGTKQRTYTKAVKLIAKLAKHFSIPQEQVKMHFTNPHFAGLLNAAMQKIEVPHIDFSHYDFLQGPAALDKEVQLDYEVYINNQWTKPIQGRPITGLKITTTSGEILYRCWSGGGWSTWSTEPYYNSFNSIEGFQFEANVPNYKLQFRVHFKNSNWTQWKNKPLSIPYKKPIDDIEFKLIKEGDI